MPTAMPCLAPGLWMTMLPWPWLISSRSFRLISVADSFSASNSARLLKSTSKAVGVEEILFLVGREETLLGAPGQLLGVHAQIEGFRFQCHDSQAFQTRTSPS